MAIAIKLGLTVPTSSDLVNYQLGYCTSDNGLYIGTSDGPVKLNSSTVEVIDKDDLGITTSNATFSQISTDKTKYVFSFTLARSYVVFTIGNFEYKLYCYRMGAGGIYNDGLYPYCHLYMRRLTSTQIPVSCSTTYKCADTTVFKSTNNNSVFYPNQTYSDMWQTGYDYSEILLPQGWMYADTNITMNLMINPFATDPLESSWIKFVYQGYPRTSDSNPVNGVFQISRMA